MSERLLNGTWVVSIVASLFFVVFASAHFITYKVYHNGFLFEPLLVSTYGYFLVVIVLLVLLHKRAQ